MISLFQSIFAAPRDLLLVILSAWLGLGLSERRSGRHAVNLEILGNLLLLALLGFALGGRLFYALEHLSVFIPSPLSLFSFNLSLFDPAGGLAAGLLAAVIYGRRKGLQFWPALDALTPFMASLTIGLALSHLATGQAFGQATGVPWAIEQWGELRHPTQVYETIAALAILILILLLRPEAPAGRDFMVFAALTSAGQLILAGYRGDNVLLFNGLRLAQIIAWFCLAAALFGLEKLAGRPAIEPNPPAESKPAPPDEKPSSPIKPKRKAAPAAKKPKARRKRQS